MPTVAPVLTGRYLMSFHACNPTTTDCHDIRNHMTYVAQSDDGASWSPIPGYQSYSGSVPDLIRRANTLYVYTVGLPAGRGPPTGIVRRYRIDRNTWEPPVSVRLQTASGATERYVDPSLSLDEQGRIVLVYLLDQTSPPDEPARCSAGQTSCTKLFHSATEVAGSDGAAFTVDPGDRARVTLGANDIAADPDIFRGPAGYVQYISRGPSIQVYTSPDLRGQYQLSSTLPGGMLTNSAGGIPAGYYDRATNQYWTFVHSSQSPSALPVIRRAVHTSLDRPLADSDFVTVLSGATFHGLGPGFRVESPGFALNVTASP